LAMARRDALLRDIEYYQNGLGQQLRLVSDDIIIDAEVNEEAVSVHETEISPVDSAQSAKESTSLSAMSQRNMAGSKTATNSNLDSHAGSSDQAESTHVPYTGSSRSTPVPFQATGARTRESSGKLIESSGNLSGSAGNPAGSAVLSPTIIGPPQEAAEIALPTVEPAIIEPAIIEPAIIEPAVAESAINEIGVGEPANSEFSVPIMQTPTQPRAAGEPAAMQASMPPPSGRSGIPVSEISSKPGS